MLRVSTTVLESFRLCCEYDWMTEADLVASIRGVVRPNRAMALGHAFDAVLNDPDAHRVPGGYEVGEFFFRDDMMRPALDLFDRRGLFQVKSAKVYGDVYVVAVADQLIGAEIVENKTTCGAFRLDKYFDSLQWRFMADIFTPRRITYRVFCLDDPEGDDDCPGGGDIELRGIETFNLYPYATLHADCQQWVDRFLDFVRAQNLSGLLRERQTEKGLVL